MGASEWYYFVPYEPDVQHAFAQLQRKVLTEGDYWQGGVGVFASWADLVAAKQTEDFWEAGTHSILDINQVDAPNQPDDIAAIRPLRPEEARTLLGSETPTRPDFDRHRDSDSYITFARWSGRCTVLYNGGQPHEIVFWGYSGD